LVITIHNDPQPTANRLSLYRRYHAWRFASHVHWLLFVVYVAGITTGIFLDGGGWFQRAARADTDDASITITSDGDWNAGTLSNVTAAGGSINLNTQAWNYRQEFSVSNSDTDDLNEYQVTITVDTAALVLAGKLQTDCSDLRFFQVDDDDSETALDYYIDEATCNTSTTSIWVQVSDIPASSSRTVRMYYGNPSALAGSNIDDTFGYATPRTIGYLVGNGPAAYDHSVVSLVEDNTITDGTTTLTLGNQESGALSASGLSEGTAIQATGLAIAQVDSTTGVQFESIVPSSFAGTRFLFRNISGSNDPHIGIVSPWGDASVSVYQAGVLQESPTVGSSGTTVDLTASAGSVIRVDSDIPILTTYWEGASHYSQIGYPVTTAGVYGMLSAGANILAGPSSTNWAWTADQAETDSGTTSADSSSGISSGDCDLVGTCEDGTGPSMVVSTTNSQPLTVIQHDDGDGTEGSVFLPTTEMGLAFGSANPMGYAVLISNAADFNCSIISSVGVIVDTDTSGSGGTVNKVFLGSTTSHNFAGTGWKIICSSPVTGYVDIDDSAIAGVDDETTLLSSKQARQYNYPAPTVGSFGSETAVDIQPYGSYESDDTSSTFDVVWNGGWGDGTAGSTALEANVTVPSNSSIRFKARSATTTGGLSGASYGTVGTATSTGLFTVPASAFASVATGLNRYIQVKAELLSSNATANPTLADMTLHYQEDNELPTNPTATGQASGSDSTPLTSGNWYNYSTPKFTLAGASDADAGIAGYYVYFGTDASATPSSAGTFQTASTYMASLSAGQSGSTFYLRVQSRDNASNIYTSGSGSYTLFTYKYDSEDPDNPSFITVTPAGYANTNDFLFDWPTGADDDSGLAGYYYKTGESGDTDTLTTETSLDNVQAYQDGTNTFMVRSVDVAGNIADSYVQASYFYSINLPSAPANVEVSPASSETNDFTFSWDEPASFTAPIAVYRYSINALPTASNTTATTSETVGPIPAATQQGTNTFYVVAEDEAGNISYSQYGSVSFTATTTAPGIPVNFILVDSSDRDLQRYSNTLSWDEPDDVGSGVDHYLLFRATSDGDQTLDDDDLSLTQIASLNSTAYIDADLDNGTRYYYQVFAEDDAGARSAGSTIVNHVPEGRFTSPPAFTEQPTVSPQPFRATVRWETERAASSFVDFGVASVDEDEQGTAALVIDHEVVIEGLTERTTYLFRVKSVDRDNNIALSTPASFTTTAAPFVTNVLTDDVRLFSAVITWETNVPTTSRVDYGTTRSFGQSQTDTSGSLTTNHTMVLLGLDHSTTYMFRLRGVDASGNPLRSDDYSFTTLTFPTVLPGTQFINLAEGQTEVRWTTNVPTDSTVEYVADDIGRTQGSEAQVTDHRVLLFGLDDATTYATRVRGNDRFGNEAVSDLFFFTTLADTTPPIISAIKSESNTRGFGDESRVQLIVAWHTNEPTTGQIEYGAGELSDVYPEQTDVNEELVFNHTLVIADLAPAKQYSFQIVSTDQAGNVARSDALSLLTSTRRRSFLQLVIEELERTFRWVNPLVNRFR